MTDTTTILVPVRYPLTAQSERTLAAAGRLTREYAPADLTVLHVDLYQRGRSVQNGEVARAVSSTLDGVEASVTIREGFLVEEVILEEATQLHADIVVVGENQQAGWRNILSRLLRTNPDVSVFLRENARATTKIIEVDTVAETPTVEVV